ncbi:MAG TPA: hypothetical protein ENI27_03700 [bacterium]|nr:hypothetical protein [bacterium]
MLETIPEGPAWVQIVWVILGGLITVLLVPYLRSKKKAAESEATANELGAMDLLLGSLKSFLLDEAVIIAEQKFPKIAMKIIKEEMKGPGAVKAELQVWGRELRDRAKEHFLTRGIDLAETFGDEYLDRAIRVVADRVSPFPGVETAVKIFEEEWSSRLVKYGVDWVRERFLEDEEPDSSDS